VGACNVVEVLPCAPGTEKARIWAGLLDEILEESASRRVCRGVMSGWKNCGCGYRAMYHMG